MASRCSPPPPTTRARERARVALGTAIEGAIYAETIPFNETRDYVKKVMANATYYAHVGAPSTDAKTAPEYHRSSRARRGNAAGRHAQCRFGQHGAADCVCAMRAQLDIAETALMEGISDD